MIELRDVSKRYAQRVALAPTSLSLRAGATTVLIGPSGCGKSTLLRIVLGLIAPDSGAVVIGEDQMDASNVQRLRHRIGYVIQDGGLFPHLSARGNIELMARHLGWDERRIADRLAQLCTLTRLDAELLNRYPLQLSGGQRQRIGLMRALMLDPPMLLLDEPLGALDPMVRSELQAELRTIFAQLGKTVLMVTHDMNEAAYLGADIVLMRAGAVLQRGVLADLLERPADPFVTEFIRAQRSHLESVRSEG